MANDVVEAIQKNMLRFDVGPPDFSSEQALADWLIRTESAAFLGGARHDQIARIAAKRLYAGIKEIVDGQ